MRTALVAALAAALCGTALAGDVFVLADGRTFPARVADPPGASDFAASGVTVLDENLDGVTYRIEGVPTKQTFPRAQIRRVVHDPSAVPADLADGASLAARGKFDEARAKFSYVAKNAAAPPWAQAEAAYRRAETYATAGDAAAAERALATFATERPRSRFVVEGKRLRAKCLADLGRDDDARAEYDSIGQIPGATDDEVLDARFLALWTNARAALRTGEPAALAAAGKSFDELRPKLVGRSALAARCEAARSACAGAATDLLTSLAADSSDGFVLAVADSLAAEALRRRGSEKKDRAALEEAQERFLRVALLRADAEGASDLVAAAHLRAGEIFVALAPEEGPDAAEAKTRARREWEDVVRRFPKSEWATRARAALAGLQ